jgi:uncharacterized protein YndB with AHSA1/START domain
MLEPLVHELALRAPAAHAYQVFVTRIGQWWLPRYTMEPDTLEDIVIEPRVGGWFYARHRGQNEHAWGRVKRVEPGRRIVTSFSLAMPPSMPPAELDIRFEDGKLVLVHGGWQEGNAVARDRYGDWPAILASFVVLADAG